MNALTRIFAGRGTSRRDGGIIRVEPKLETRDAGITTAGSNPGLWNAIAGFTSNTGIPVTHITALNHDTVYHCVRRISEDVAKTPFKLSVGDDLRGYDQVISHPLVGLLRDPNDFQTSFDFWKIIVSSIQLRGNAYVYVHRDPNGEPVRLTPILPDRCFVNVSPGGLIVYQVSHPTFGQGKTITCTGDNLIHIRGGLSLDGGIMGVSAITLCQDSLGNALAVQRHANTLFKRGANPQFAVSFPAGANLQNDGVKDLRKAYEAAYSGADNAHGIFILDSGATIQPITMTAQDAQLLESRKFNVIQICRLFGVPPSKVFDMDKATFNNAESMEAQYISDTLSPLCTKLAQCFMKGLMFPWERDTMKLWFDVSAGIYVDEKSNMEAMQIGTNTGIYTVNEARVKLGEARDETDPSADKRRVPSFTVDPTTGQGTTPAPAKETDEKAQP